MAFPFTIHYRIGIFWIQFLRKRCKAVQIAKHDGNRLCLALYLLTLREDLLSEALGEISLNLVQLVFKGEVFGLGPKRRRRSESQALAALTAELLPGLYLCITPGTPQGKFCSTFRAESLARFDI